jgi:hypothetical protein
MLADGQNLFEDWLAHQVGGVLFPQNPCGLCYHARHMLTTLSLCVECIIIMEEYTSKRFGVLWVWGHVVKATVPTHPCNTTTCKLRRNIMLIDRMMLFSHSFMHVTHAFISLSFVFLVVLSFPPAAADMKLIMLLLPPLLPPLLLDRQGTSWQLGYTSSNLISSGALPPFVVVGIDSVGSFRSFNYLPYPPGSGQGGFRGDCERWVADWLGGWMGVMLGSINS